MRAALVVFLLLLATAAEAKTIWFDPGGTLAYRYLEVLRVKQSGEKVAIRGVCASACTYYLSLPRDQVCVGRLAKLIFHQASLKGKRSDFGSTHLLNSYPHWAREWIASRGGLTGKLLVMPASHARKFMRTC